MNIIQFISPLAGGGGKYIVTIMRKGGLNNYFWRVGLDVKGLVNVLNEGVQGF